MLGDFTELLAKSEASIVELAENYGRRVALAFDGSRARLVSLAGDGLDESCSFPDLVFPLVHGPGGEDGTLQGLLSLSRVPFVGAGTTASALAMDKLAMKALCRDAGVSQVDFFDASALDATVVAEILESGFGYPCFVKPANLGSSVGISRVEEPARLGNALVSARRWDRRVIVEQAVDAREIEVALLGNDHPSFSPPGEVVSAGGFYDFDEKYRGSRAELLAPTELPSATVERLHQLCSEVWALVGCRGMARADFFIDKGSGELLFNELNTIPGFTAISMYPKLWAAAGLDMAGLVDRLLELALESG